MTYTIIPAEKHAKAYGRNLRISTKDAIILCRVIRKKPLERARRLLNDLDSKKRSLKGSYYSKAVAEILGLLESCEKNAEFLGLDPEKLLVHASAHTGPVIRRRRRKSAFGSRMKSTNMEIILIEKGKKKKETLEQLKKMERELKKKEEKKEEMKDNKKESK
jgi:ribosomal protein L22